MKLLNVAGAYYEGWKFKRSTIGRALALHTQEYLYKTPSLSGFSQQAKDRLANDLYARVDAISDADNPVAACREMLVEYVIAFCGVSGDLLNGGGEG